MRQGPRLKVGDTVGVMVITAYVGYGPVPGYEKPNPQHLYELLCECVNVIIRPQSRLTGKKPMLSCPKCKCMYRLERGEPKVAISKFTPAQTIKLWPIPRRENG